MPLDSSLIIALVVICLLVATVILLGRKRPLGETEASIKDFLRDNRLIPCRWHKTTPLSVTYLRILIKSKTHRDIKEEELRIILPKYLKETDIDTGFDWITAYHCRLSNRLNVKPKESKGIDPVEFIEI